MRFHAALLLNLFLTASFAVPAPTGGADEKNDDTVRPALLAGSWYPGTRGALSAQVRQFLSGATPPPLFGTLKALISPHAGYVYSGQVAAYGYRLLEGSRFKRVILVGPSHRVGFRGVSVNLQSGYETPLGVVPVDREMGRKIMASGAVWRWVPRAHAQEHSLEIQLPFLQSVLPDFHIVPILMGDQDYGTCEKLAASIATLVGHAEDTLLLASTDLSHFYASSEARRLDGVFLSRVKDFDPKGLATDLAQGRCEACGGGPVVTILLAARRLGADKTKILHYADSGDVTGDHRRVVGYLSAAVIKSSGRDPRPQ
jgi:AmmeMemoRadiSam system protein B